MIHPSRLVASVLWVVAALALFAGSVAPGLWAAPAPKAAAFAAKARVVLNEAEYRDKVYACWLGKNIGGTLGMRFEGQRTLHNLTFFDPVPKVPAANDDLDLQILWLKVVEERGPRITARDLGEYWLKFVPVDWNEYGVGKANMRLGFQPPLSGHYRNNKWRDSNGAWIRSEIWACLAPGCPDLAARYAWEDACVDHGAAEGTYAELFTASVESAAFVEKDRDKLLQIGLSYVPADCAVAKSIRAAIEAKKNGLDLKTAREAVLEASKSTGWFMAPQNVAFTVLGWLYGEGDFGKSICAAVNCGDDTDCTGATLGSIFGILYGTKGISERWREPVGTGIKNVAIGGFPAPKTLDELTERTVATAPKVLASLNAPVEIRADAPADPRAAMKLKLVDPAAARALWARSPWQLIYQFPQVNATLDFLREPEVEIGKSRSLKLLLTNPSTRPLAVTVAWRLPDGVVAEPLRATLTLPAKGRGVKAVEVALRAETVGSEILRGSVEITPAGQAAPDTIPFALAAPLTVSRDDLALARLGTTATSDSELEREKGCTPRAIDGEIAQPDGFEGKRWHSALTPHPHWLALRLAKPATLGRVIVHFSDPQGHPVDFECQVSADGATWRTVCAERGYRNTRRYEKAFEPVEAQHFRLTIQRSASKQYPDAAQVGEIELLAK